MNDAGLSTKVAAAARRAVVDDIEALEESVVRLTRQNGELQETNQRLLQEVILLREQVTRSTRDFQRVQAFAVRLSSQLGVLRSIIDNAERDAEAYGAHAAAEPTPAADRLDKALHDLGKSPWPSTGPRGPIIASEARSADKIPPVSF